MNTHTHSLISDPSVVLRSIELLHADRDDEEFMEFCFIVDGTEQTSITTAVRRRDTASTFEAHGDALRECVLLPLYIDISICKEYLPKMLLDMKIPYRIVNEDAISRYRFTLRCRSMGKPICVGDVVGSRAMAVKRLCTMLQGFDEQSYTDIYGTIDAWPDTWSGFVPILTVYRSAACIEREDGAI